MKGNGYLYEIAAIGYLRNDEGNITETNILYPITSIISKDYESAKFELIRQLTDKDIEEYGTENIKLIVRCFDNTVSMPGTSSSYLNITTGTGINGLTTTY